MWDTEFVERVGRDPTATARRLIASMSDEQRELWAHGITADWAMESFALARDHAYGLLPVARADGMYVLSPAYVDVARRDVAAQLSKAGVRLAFLLNGTLAVVQRAGR